MTSVRNKESVKRAWSFHNSFRIAIEVTPEWLGGTEGVNQLFNLMSDAGLTGYELLSDGKVGSIVKPADIKKQVDVLFLRSLHTQF